MSDLDPIALLTDLSRRARDPSDTEADTRAIYVDPILRQLGWRNEDVRREPYDGWSPNPGFADYLLKARGQPHLVVEVKKDSRAFDVPAKLAKAGTTTLKNLIATGSKDLREAVDQCKRYSQHCGAPYACATNGRTFIFFKPLHPGRPQAEAKVVVFADLAAALRRFDEFEAVLGRESVEAGGLESRLVGHITRLATFAKRLGDQFSSGGYQTLETEEFAKIADYITANFLIEIPDEESFHRCYVPVPWTRTTDDAIEALIRNQSAAYARASSALVDPEALIPTRALDEVLGELKGRSVVLHGPIGIGKSSYLRHLGKRLEDKGTSRNRCIWVRADLLPFRERAYSDDASDAIIEKLSELLRDGVAQAAQRLRHDADPEEWKHLRDIYNRESHRFQKERYPDSDDSDPVYLEAVRDYVFKLKERDAREHFVRTVEWLTGKLSIPTVLVLDNSDQLGLDFQEYLYDLASTLDRRTSAVTIICLRTDALSSHRIRDHSLARIEERYEVRRPPLVDVLKRRFDEVERYLKPRVDSTKDPNVKVAFERIWALLQTITRDFREGLSASQIIELVGNNNLRRTFEAISRVFKQDPRVMDRLVVTLARNPSRARLEPNFVLRAILKGTTGRYRSSDPNTLIPNIFSVDTGAEEHHLLASYILRHLLLTQERDDAASLGAVVSSLALAGLDPERVRKALGNLHRWQLIEAGHMLGELRDSDVLRATRLGEGMIQTLIEENEYLDAIAWDTIIYDEFVFSALARIWRQGPRKTRYATLRSRFRQYLENRESAFRDTFLLHSLPGAAWAGPIIGLKHKKPRSGPTTSHRGRTAAKPEQKKPKSRRRKKRRRGGQEKSNGSTAKPQD